MNIKTIAMCGAAALMLTSASGQALAQGRGGGGGGGAGGSAPGSVALPSGRGDLDRDRLRDRVDTPDQDRLRDRDQTGDQDRLRDRDQLMLDQQVSAWSILSDAERAQFHQEMQAAKTAQERNQIRAQHRQTIQARARELGLADPFGSGAGASAARQQLALQQVLTQQERAQFQQEMRAATTAQERERIRNQHRQLIQERAREMGIDVPAGAGLGRGPR